MSQRLIIEDDEGTTTIVPLGKDAVTIGRQQGNTIQLTEKNVSRRHARLYPEQALWVIEDLASYNGVKVNGAPIDGRVTLKEGDVVQIGDYHLALTEDVDKRTLNYPPTAAANDPAVIEPMLASSSTDLPRLSVEELAALQSGPHPVSQPALLDSGPMPATPMPIGFEERRKGGAGVLVGFGVVVAVALVGGIAWMAVGGDDDDKATQVAAADGKAGPADAEERAPPAEDKAVEPTPPPPDPTPADEGAAEPAEGGALPAEDPPEAADDGEAEVVIPDDPPEAVDDPPEPSGSPGKKSRNKTKDKPKQPAIKKEPGPPPAPPAPAVDVGALLTEARKAALKDPAKGYELANKALKAGGGRAAAELMATCACRMKDAGKAKRAISRLSGATREKYVELCRDKGITL
jgi:hypothetical protein